MNDITNKVLAKISESSIDTNQEFAIKKEILDYVSDYMQKYEDIGVSVFVNDYKKKHWKPKDHFTKIFNDEIKHAKELYSLSNGEVNFLYNLSPLLKWELNLLVNEEDVPINQSQLVKLLEMDSKTVRKYVDLLVDKKLLYEIKMDRQIYYIVNPYIMYCGQFINLIIVKIFDDIGYKNKVSRNSRKKKAQKPSIIKGN